MNRVSYGFIMFAFVFCGACDDSAEDRPDIDSSAELDVSVVVLDVEVPVDVATPLDVEASDHDALDGLPPADALQSDSRVDAIAEVGVSDASASDISVVPDDARPPDALVPDAGCASQFELCGNGQDDDCDGEIDEGFERLGSPCSNGIGICERFDVWHCSIDLLTLMCPAEPGEPAFCDPQQVAVDECDNNCDGLDDDCDGFADEGMSFVGETCQLGQGVCAIFGEMVCLPEIGGPHCSVHECVPDFDRAPAAIRCLLDPPPEVYVNLPQYEEVEVSCDGLDNDCNGVVDDSPPCPLPGQE